MVGKITEIRDINEEYTELKILEVMSKQCMTMTLPKSDKFEVGKSMSVYSAVIVDVGSLDYYDHKYPEGTLGTS